MDPSDKEVKSSNSQKGGVEATKLKDEARVHLGTLRDLGPEYEDEVVDSFVEKVQRSLDSGRIEREEADRTRSRGTDTEVNFGALISVALCVGLPLTAVAGGIAGASGIVVVWVSHLQSCSSCPWEYPERVRFDHT